MKEYCRVTIDENNYQRKLEEPLEEQELLAAMDEYRDQILKQMFPHLNKEG